MKMLLVLEILTFNNSASNLCVYGYVCVCVCMYVCMYVVDSHHDYE